MFTPEASNLYTSSLDPSGINATTTFTYDANGDVKTVADPRGYVTEMDYDNDRRKTLTRHHDGALAANVVAAERSTYDTLGQLRKEEGGIAFSGTSVTTWQSIRTTTYSPTGKVLTETDNAGNVTSHSYDFNDRESVVTDPENRRVAKVYDAVGQTLCIWRAWNSTAAPTSCLFDPSTFTVNSPIRYAEYSYSLDGLVLTSKDAANNLTTSEYDGFNRLKTLRFPVITKGASASSATDFEQYDYDENGNRKSLRKRDANVILSTFDNLDRRVLKDIPSGTSLDVYSDYDLAGRPLYAHFGSASGWGVDYSYDGAKRLKSESTNGKGLSFGYDLSGNRTTLTFQDANYFVYDFDALNRVSKIRENGATSGAGVLSSITWDPLSRRDYVSWGNGTLTDYGYDAASRLGALTQDLAGTLQDLNRTFTRNNAGQIRTRVTAQANYVWSAALANKSYTPDGLNRYADSNYSYDANGNLTGDGTRAFLYDAENRLVRVTKAGIQTDLSYDPIGRLYSSSTAGSTTKFLYDGDRLIAEYNGSDVLQRRYIHGPSVDEPIVWYEGSALADKRWFHADERGSVVATSDSSGNGTQYTYGPYGEPANWSGSRFKFTGQIAIPEAQLYHYKARVYDPMLGRFLQTDPIGARDDVNLYAYVSGDPIDRADPTGEKCEGTKDNASCTADSVNDENGKSISRDDALKQMGGKVAQFFHASLHYRVLKQEKKATKGYVRALKKAEKAAPDNQVTVAGDPTKGVIPQNANAADVVTNMQTVDLIYTDHANPDVPNATMTTHKVNGVAVSIEMWQTRGNATSFIHEGLHTVTNNWDAYERTHKEEHQTPHQGPYNDAARKF